MSVVANVVTIASASLTGSAAAVFGARRSRDQNDRDGTKPPGRPPAGPSGVARWCLALGAGACLLAGTLVAVVGATQARPGQIPMTLLLGAVVALAVLALWIGAGILRRGISEKKPDLTLYAVAGLIAAGGALAATFIAGTG